MRTRILALLLPLSLTMGARQLTPAEALSRAENSEGRLAVKGNLKAQPAPVMEVKAKSAPSFTGLYVFKTSDNGFMIVSADDTAMPLLGYSDTNNLDVKNLPLQLEYWLQFYADQIYYGSRHGAKAVAQKAAANSESKPAIAPMTTSKWNQSAPYNDDCPMDNGARSVTGCVATAMAQGMYYHKWPQTGTGSHSYEWNDQKLSLDFGSITYDWANMTNTYDDKSTSAEKAAVAQLMYSCGVSVDMDYTSDESGASSLNMAPALYKYFGYDKSMAQPQRSYYGESDWENMVYDQLANGMPVLYGGQSGEGGHEFVCDGYDGNGYFHFNWGWGGMSDGYFLLSALDPLEQGIGGSGSDSGFNYDQGILINMKPAQSDSKVTPLIYCYGNFGSKQSSVELGKEIDLTGTYFNFACTDITGQPGIKLTSSQGDVTYIKHSAKLGFAAISGYDSYSVTLPSDLAEGTYTVTPVFLPEGESEYVDILCPLSGVQALTMTVSNGEATLADAQTVDLQVSDFTLNSPIYLGEDFSVSFTLTNAGKSEYFGEYLLYLFDENGDEVAPAADINSIDLLPGASVQVNYVSKFPTSVTTESGTTSEVEPGSYVLGMFTHFTQQQIYIYPDMVNVQAAPSSTQIEVTSINVDKIDVEDDSAKVTFNGQVECLSGYFGGQVKIAVFKENASETDMSGKSDYVFIDEGETSDFTAVVDVKLTSSSESFYAVAFDSSNEQISNAFPFTISTTGIVATGNYSGITIKDLDNNIEVISEYPIDTVSLYSIGGELITNQSVGSVTGELSVENVEKGVYIVIVKDVKGNVSSAKVIR